MNIKYFQVFISVENEKQADEILEVLLKKKLAAGGMITYGPSRFWWKGKIVRMDYYNISAFTTERKLEALIDEVKRISVEDVQMIWRVPLNGNPEFLHWIDTSLS